VEFSLRKLPSTVKAEQALIEQQKLAAQGKEKKEKKSILGIGKSKDKNKVKNKDTNNNTTNNNTNNNNNDNIFIPWLLENKCLHEQNVSHDEELEYRKKYFYYDDEIDKNDLFTLQVNLIIELFS
jgi:hypothetical protein